jgi:uncharacterized protein YybS (DUF2232 family)
MAVAFIWLCLVYPAASIFSAFFFARKKLCNAFLLYILVFSLVHFMIYESLLGRLDLLWIVGFVIVPGLCIYSMTTSARRKYIVHHEASEQVR